MPDQTVAPQPTVLSPTSETAAVRRPRRLPVSLIVLLVIVAYALCLPAVAPEAWLGVDLGSSRQAPSAAHWFGTDASGRDLFVRVAQGLRVSLLMAAVAAAVATGLGLLVGTTAAATGGWLDAVLMRSGDFVNALPHLLLGLVVVAFFPGSIVAIIASIALTHWPQVARIVRSEALSVAQSEFVDAAYLAGASRGQVTRMHLLPAAFGQAVVAITLLVPHAIWHESTLSFLGLGLSPDRASLGTLLEVSRGEILLGGWWSLLFPSLALVITTTAIAGLGRSLRTRVAPRTRTETR